MKTNYYPLLLALLGFSILLNIFLFKDAKEQLEIIHPNNLDGKPITFIWNDDEEAIPMDNTPILLEFSNKTSDTIYIGSIEGYQSPEYQFTVTDDSISVSDFGRTVGTVKIEGQLKQLIDKDNQ
jgi:hypothetical protein